MARHRPASEPSSASGPTAQADSPNVEPADPSDFPAVWQALLGLLARHGRGLGALLAPANYVGVQDGQAVIRYSAEHQTLIKLLERNGKKDLVRDALSQVLGQPVGVRFDVTSPSAPAQPQQVQPRAAPSPAPAAAGPAAPSVGPVSIPLTSDLLSQVQQDPLIRAVIDELGGQVVRVSEP
jgi:hypothetical protein